MRNVIAVALTLTVLVSAVGSAQAAQCASEASCTERLGQ